ncbi:MAG: PspC domain-containing protein [Lapillicoccus sp.]
MTQSPAPVPALEKFFTALHRSQVTRSPRGRIAGVCAGIAERLDLSVTAVRVAAVVLAILGPAVALYLVAWLLLPDSKDSIQLERALRQSDGSSVALLVVTLIVLVSDLGVHARVGWLSLVLLAAIAWAIYRGRGRDVAPPTAGPRSGDSPAAR